MALAATSMPRWPRLWPLEAVTPQSVPGDVGRSAGAGRLHGRRDPGNLGHVGGAADEFAAGTERLDSGAQARGRLAHGGLEGLGKIDLRRRETGRSDTFQVLVQQAVAGAVGQVVVHAGDKIHPVGGAGHQGGALGDLENPVIEFLHTGAVLLAHVVPELGRVGNDVGRPAAVQIDVVDARRGRHVFAQVVDADVHQLGRVQGAAAQPGIGGGVGGASEKRDLEVVQRLAGAGGHRGPVPRMPGDGRVQIVEYPVAGHVGLAHHRLLGRAAKELERSRQALRFHGLFHRQGGAQAGAAEQVVAAAVPRSAGQHRLLFGRRLLRETGQGVVFGQQADQRFALSVGGDEGGGHAGHPLLNGESLFFQSVNQQRGRAVFLQRGLGELPDLQADAGQAFLVLIQPEQGALFASAVFWSG